MSAKPAAALPEGWPVMDFATANAALTAPGLPFEMEDSVVNGVSMKVYKNAYPNLRALFETGRATWGPRDMVVFENERRAAT